MIRIVFLTLVGLMLMACGQEDAKSMDATLFYNGKIYTCDSNFSIVNAMIVKSGKISATGDKNTLLKDFGGTVNQVDLKGNTIYPGLFDAHCHFYALGRLQSRLDLKGVPYWDEVIEKVEQYAQENPEGWVLGRGWDQTLFKDKKYPSNASLNERFPNRPILLRRVDGHAAIANAKALELAGLKASTVIDGGEIGIEDGELNGFLLDNAVDLVMEAIPDETNSQVAAYLLKAQELCLKVGLTSVTDAGLSPQVLNVADSLYQSKELIIRINAMVSATPEGLAYAKSKGSIERSNFRVKSFKIYGDGALGSRGALLKKPYCDRRNYTGLLLTPIDSIKKYCNWAVKNNYQICTHAIGDSANKLLLNIYGKYTKGKDLRWRIEHAQVVDTVDIKLFKFFNIIPSIQPTHATSDMRWAADRLCEERLSGAYAYQSLLQAYGLAALGTDFPIEDYNPVKTFFAAVYRKNEEMLPDNGFLIGEGLSEKQALWGMTKWAAFAQFDEKRLGSLEKGMTADFIVLEKDWMGNEPKMWLNQLPTAVYIDGVKQKRH